MLLTYARAFTFAATSVEFCRGQVWGRLVAQDHSTIQADDDLGGPTKAAVLSVRELCADIPSLQNVCFEIDRLLDKLTHGIGPLLLFNDLQHLQHRLMDELRSHYYYPVTQEAAALYGNEAPFGQSVFDNFPSARVDAMNAGRCIILNQGTAGVFHLMRVMEVGLRVLSRKLGIPYAPSWEAHLTQISKKMAERHTNKTAAWKRQQSLFSDLSGDLTVIKFAWRNPTMHIAREYSMDEAGTIYKAVSTFMQRMADAKFKETGKAVAPQIAVLTSQTNP